MLRRYSTRFPTKYNAVRSAWKQKILTPEGVSENPSPAAPSAYETPNAFIPKSDTRVYKKEQKWDVESMPVASPLPRRTYHLTDKDFIEIQRLRDSEPEKWTRKALAEKFGVSEFVIGLASRPNEARDAEMQERLATIKEMWTDKRARARNHRQRRKEFWLRDA